MHCTRTIKRIAVGLLALMLFSAVSVPAFADDGRPIGNFLTDDRESTETESGEAAEEERMVILSNGVLYDPDRGMFYREIGSSSFGTSVPDGMITTGTVSAELAPALTGALYRNGVKIEGAELSAISEPGKYVLAVSTSNSAQTVRVNFTIVSSPTGSVKEYNLPEDFFVVSATLNGERADYSRAHVDMTKDGEYEIQYRSPKANKDYCLSVTIDHTPPTATLSGLVDGKSNELVVVSGVEEGAKVYLERNGKDVPYTGTIEQTGSYVLTVQDMAGNETKYEFVVITYSSGGVNYLAAMGIVLVLALGGYFIYYRKFMRVN